MASLTQWTWDWASAWRWGRTGKSSVLQFMGLQRVKHDWVTEQQQQLFLYNQLFFLQWIFYCVTKSLLSLSCVQLCISMYCSMPGFPVHHQLQELLKLISIKLMLPPSHLIFCCPLPIQPFWASGSFSMRQFFTLGGQNIGVSPSTSVFSMSMQGWFPLGFTGWISMQSKRLSRVFSNTTVQKHQFFSVQLSLWSNTHIHWKTIDANWKNHRLINRILLAM